MDSESAKDARGDPTQPADRVELRIFSDSSLAELARARLEANGIECWLTADDCGGMLAAMDTVRGVKLLVRRSDSDAARALLASESAAADEPFPDEPASSTVQAKDSSPRIKLSLPQLIAGVIVGVLLCLLYQWTSKFGTRTYRYDWDEDGKPDERWVYRNDLPAEGSYDRNFDGKFDYWDHYDRTGRRILIKGDENFDGIPDATWRYTNGMLASGELDRDFNGIADVTQTFMHELVRQSDWQPNGTNIVTMRQIFRHGVLAEESQDINADGSFDVTVYYDAFETPIATNSFKFVLPTSSP